MINLSMAQSAPFTRGGVFGSVSVSDMYQYSFYSGPLFIAHNEPNHNNSCNVIRTERNAVHTFTVQ